MNKFIEKLYTIESDKYIHLLACLILSFFISTTCNIFINTFISILIGFSITMLIGYYKETKDDFYDKIDIKYDCIGTCIGIILFIYYYLTMCF